LIKFIGSEESSEAIKFTMNFQKWKYGICGLNGETNNSRNVKEVGCDEKELDFVVLCDVDFGSSKWIFICRCCV
jgi:hypothetical protein